MNWLHSHTVHMTAFVFEWFFFVNLIIKFFREFTPENEVKPCRDLRKCAKNYLKTDFIIDFIALIPFPYILKFANDEQDMFFLIKHIRMYDLFLTFNRRKLANSIGKWFYFNVI